MSQNKDIKNNDRRNFAIRIFSQSSLSCLIFMVQGNFLLLTIGHIGVAAQVGAICSLIFILIYKYSINFLRNKWYLATAVFIITTIVDYFSHPSHFGEHYTEAVVTGLGAAAISLFISFFLIKKI